MYYISISRFFYPAFFLHWKIDIFSRNSVWSWIGYFRLRYDYSGARIHAGLITYQKHNNVIVSNYLGGNCFCWYMIRYMNIFYISYVIMVHVIYVTVFCLSIYYFLVYLNIMMVFYNAINYFTEDIFLNSFFQIFFYNENQTIRMCVVHNALLLYHLT